MTTGHSSRWVMHGPESSLGEHPGTPASLSVTRMEKSCHFAIPFICVYLRTTKRKENNKEILVKTRTQEIKGDSSLRHLRSGRVPFPLRGTLDLVISPVAHLH